LSPGILRDLLPVLSNSAKSPDAGEFPYSTNISWITQDRLDTEFVFVNIKTVYTETGPQAIPLFVSNLQV
jgi:hypothetical protein